MTKSKNILKVNHNNDQTLDIGLGKERKTVVNVFYREWTGGVTGLSDNDSQIERLSRQVEY